MTEAQFLQCALCFDADPDQGFKLTVSGHWRMAAKRPPLAPIAAALDQQTGMARLRFACEGLESWDSSFIAFLVRFLQICEDKGVKVDADGLPAGARRLLALAAATPAALKRSQSPPETRLGRIGQRVCQGGHDAGRWIVFIGEISIAMVQLMLGKARFRASELVFFFQKAGPEALPIVTLISVLVGLILAFVGALQLQVFGAEIFVANLVGVGMAREMGALMTGVIMAGRTGAAYAAQLGSMQVNEEIDALRTLGIAPVEYLVLPRLLGLVLAMPLLCLYADFMGIVGGFIVAVGGLDLGAREYYVQTTAALKLSDFAAGLGKSLVFAILVGLSGCFRGMQCGRSSAAVGDAATAAVVSGIVLMIVADALLTVLYDLFGI